MRIRLVEIRTRTSGKKVRLERDLDVEALRIGRGPDNDLSLRGLTKPKHLVVPTLLSIVGWSLEGIGVYVILRGFGAEPSLLQTIFFYGAGTLAGALVPVPGGLGVTEKVLQESMVRIGGIAHRVVIADDQLAVAGVATLRR